MFGIIVYAYTKADNKHGCCIDSRFHRRCFCPVSITKCKLLCNQDTNCKGYVQTNFAKNDCDIATTSNCSSECSPSSVDIGFVGNLRLDGTCGTTTDYNGCFIKENGIYNNPKLVSKIP